MTPEAEIAKGIEGMGYATCTPRLIRPSYYRVNDGAGTTIRVLFVANHVVPAPDSPDGFTISYSVHISAYVPKENRRPQDFKVGRQDNVASGTTDFDVDCEPLSEDFSVYDSSNGMVVSIKAVAGQINKTEFFTPDGEPAYAVDANPIMKVKRD